MPWVIRSLMGLFRLVGECDLAERIRSTVHRVTRRQGKADPVPSDRVISLARPVHDEDNGETA